MDHVEAFLPLRPVWFPLLLTLPEQPSHGYAIRQAVETRTGGRIRLWPTTLYGNISELEDRGLIDESDSGAPADHITRHVYRLTPLGRRVLIAETERLEALARPARPSPQRRRTV